MQTSLKKNKVSEFLADGGTFSTVLLAILVDSYGTKAFEFDPETISKDLHEDYHIGISQLNSDKLNAAITIITTDLFYRDWVTFNGICLLLNNVENDFSAIDLATPEQIAWSVTEAKLLDDPKDHPEFSDEVRSFIGAVLAESGITKPIDVLSMAIMPPVQSEPDDIGQSDPEIYEGMYKKQSSDNQYIQDYIKANIHQLITQISECPLEHRDTSGWSKWADKAMKALS